MTSTDKWLLGLLFTFMISIVVLMNQWAYMFKIAIQNMR